MVGHVDPTRQAMDLLRDLPMDQPVAMINLVRFKPVADYPADHPDAHKARTGAEAYAIYRAAAAGPFDTVGGMVIWMGRPELTLIGPSDEGWDIAFIGQYPTASAFIAMIRDPDYLAIVVHRQAAVADSRLIRCQPVSGGPGLGS